MMVASWEGHHGIIEALLSADADPNLQDGVSGLNIVITEKEQFRTILLGQEASHDLTIMGDKLLLFHT